MTTQTTISCVHQIAAHRQANPRLTEADTVHDFREVQPNLADDFETWYARKESAVTKCKKEAWRIFYPSDEPKECPPNLDQSWMYAILGTTDPYPADAEIDDLDYSQPTKHLADIADEKSDSDPEVYWSRYRDQDSEFAVKKVRSRKWKLSTPPALRCKVHEKHIQNLEDRGPARKTVRRHRWVISCHEDKSSIWPETFPEDSFIGSDIASVCQPENGKLNTTFFDISWSEKMLWELSPKMRVYKTYRPSLLRWCCM